MIVGKMICEGCGKDVTNGLWGFILGVRGSLNNKQKDQLEEFKALYGKEQMVWCWDCTAKALGALPVKKKGEPAKLDLLDKKPENQKLNIKD